MLLSLSPISCGALSGMCLVLHRHWTTSAVFQTEEVLGNYTEALHRLQNDPESTKPYAAKLGSTVLSDLESASEISLRRLPDRFRRGCSLFCIMQDQRASKTRVHYKLPTWVHLSLVNESRNAFTVQHSSTEWRTLDASLDNDAPGIWQELLMNFFSLPAAKALLQSQQSLPPGITHFRMAELIQRSQIPSLAPCFSITLSGLKT